MTKCCACASLPGFIVFSSCPLLTEYFSGGEGVWIPFFGRALPVPFSGPGQKGITVPTAYWDTNAMGPRRPLGTLRLMFHSIRGSGCLFMFFAMVLMMPLITGSCTTSKRPSATLVMSKEDGVRCAAGRWQIPRECCCIARLVNKLLENDANLYTLVITAAIESNRVRLLRCFGSIFRYVKLLLIHQRTVSFLSLAQPRFSDTIVLVTLILCPSTIFAFSSHPAWLVVTLPYICTAISPTTWFLQPPL